MPKPFVKMAGGKRYLLPKINELLTDFDVENYDYHEPMVGGGAVFLDLSDKFRSRSIGDVNDELINCYQVIRDDVNGLVKELTNGSYWFKHKTDDRSKANYLRIRKSEPPTPIKKAARTIFLLKTCFNGLMRKNKAGKFNVPMGSYQDPIICDKDELRLVSGFLKGVTIRSVDVATYLDAEFSKNSFFFVDPPYHDESGKPKFISYSGGFDDKKQIALITALQSKDCKFIYTNRATSLVLDTFWLKELKYVTIDLRHSIQPRYTTGKVEKEVIVWRL